MRRVLVVGLTGAGKTTAARRIAAAIDAPFHEVDTLALGPDWSTPPDFEATVDCIVAEPSWVFDSWGYEQVREAMWRAADTIVWLDYPAWVVLPRVLRRSVGRTVRRTPVFGGNVETWRFWLSGDHPVWWSMRTVRPRRRYLANRTGAARSSHLRTLRFRHPRDFDDWLAALAGS